jgi:hypothetical protein
LYAPDPDQVAKAEKMQQFTDSLMEKLPLAFDQFTADMAERKELTQRQIAAFEAIAALLPKPAAAEEAKAA